AYIIVNLPLAAPSPLPAVPHCIAPIIKKTKAVAAAAIIIMVISVLTRLPSSPKESFGLAKGVVTLPSLSDPHFSGSAWQFTVGMGIPDVAVVGNGKERKIVNKKII